MKLEVTDYIASLKEEKELDQLIIDLLREYDFEIVFGPQKGERQYGVDIYAVGEDWEDNQKKIFLITVKQGDLDRKNWHGSPQAIQPSLQEIVSVFIRNNLVPEHKDLKIKIVVAHNGVNIGAIQQDWRGFADMFPQYQFVIWQLETIATLVTNKMINENVISPEARPLLRRVIIYLDRDDYDFSEFCQLIDDCFMHIKLDGKNKKQNIRQLRKINLILSIVLSFCKKERNYRLAIRATEISILRMWKFVSENEASIDNDYFNEFVKTSFIRKDIIQDYLDIIYPVCEVKDGFSSSSKDAVTYTLIVYEHIGMIALGGLELLQLSEFCEQTNKELSNSIEEQASAFAAALVHLINNNRIVFNPRADEQIIEWNLTFILLYKLGRTDNIRIILSELQKEIQQAKVFFNLAPIFKNNLDIIYELAVNFKMRSEFDYRSSSLLPVLAEWAMLLDDQQLYLKYVELKKEHFNSVDLILWYPDANTEIIMFTQKALPTSGYSLSGIHLTEDINEFKLVSLNDYVFNCQESEFAFFKHGFWTIGLTASRHYRTYVFPYYWRRFIKNYENVTICNTDQTKFGKS